MLPLSDEIRARRFPVVNVLLIVANFAVFLLYELPHFNAAVYHASFYPCTVDNACRGPEPWRVSWITAMFLQAAGTTSWATWCFGHLRQERRGCLWAAALPGLLLRRRVRGDDGPPPWCATSSTGWPGSPDSAPTPSRLCARPGRRPRCMAGRAWRGLLCHRVVLDGAGRLTRVAVVDPSFMTWPGLTVALEATIVPDFPRQQELQPVLRRQRPVATST